MRNVPHHLGNLSAWFLLGGSVGRKFKWCGLGGGGSMSLGAGFESVRPHPTSSSVSCSGLMAKDMSTQNPAPASRCALQPAAWPVAWAVLHTC